MRCDTVRVTSCAKAEVRAMLEAHHGPGYICLDEDLGDA